jgi:hypothetical protein
MCINILNVNIYKSERIFIDFKIININMGLHHDKIISTHFDSYIVLQLSITMLM